MTRVRVWNVLLGSLLAGAGACSSSLEKEGDSGSSGPPLGDGTSNGLVGGDNGLAAGSGEGASGFEACAGQTAGAEVSPTVLEFIVDTSGSMDDDAPGPTRGSKWEATRRAVLQAVDKMPASTALGVLFYPDLQNNDDDDNGQCMDRQVDVPLRVLDRTGSQQRQQIRSAFQNQTPRGGTPTHDAYLFGVEQLQASTLPGPRFAVVITDGIPTFSLGCDTSGRNDDNAVDPTPLGPAAATSLAAGTKTFIIGSPGSEGARESLSRMAEAGGTAIPGCSHSGPAYCHFDMTQEQDFAGALAAALGQIAGLALSCNYDIPAPPNGGEIDPSKVNVLFSLAGGQPEVIPQSPGQSCDEGWQYSPDQTQVLLCGNTCSRVRDANGSLTLQFGCSTRIR